MLKQLCLIGAAVAGLATGTAMAQQSPWMIRVRAAHLGLDTSSAPGTGGLAGVPADAITVNSKWIPDIDVTYFFTKNIAAELLLTIPQKQEVTVNAAGLGKIGTFEHLPPTLLLQYHFDLGQAKPYVGAGINYTRISSQNFTVPGPGVVSLDSNSWGLAGQIGVDIPITKNWSFNLDLKKIQIRSDVKVLGVKASDVKLDPWVFGIGVGYRF